MKELNLISTTIMIALLLLKILCRQKSLTPSKSMPQKSNNDFKDIHPYILAGTFELY